MLTENEMKTIARMVARELEKIQERKAANKVAPTAPIVYLTAKEAAEICRMSVRTLRRKKEIPRIKKGKSFYYQRKDLDAYMNP